MNIRQHQFLLSVGSAMGALVLAGGTAYLLNEVNERSLELGESSLVNLAVAQLTDESGELLVALDLLLVEQSNAFVLAEMHARRCESTIELLGESGAFEAAFLEPLARELEKVEYHAGLAAVLEVDDPLRASEIELFQASADAFVDQLGVLEQAAAELRAHNLELLPGVHRRAWVTITILFLAFLAATYALWRWSSRRLVEPLSELERKATFSVEHGSPLGVVQQGPRELVSLARTLKIFAESLESKVVERTEALAQEVAARTQAERDLQALNRELESRVGQRTLELSRSNASLAHEMLERKRTERERANLEAQLHQSQKMEAIGRLAGGIAHDFNNLLMVIEGYISLLQMEEDVQSSVQEPLKHVMEATARATDLTRQLLAFSRKQSVRPRSIDLNELLRNLRPMLARLIGEDLELQMFDEGEAALVHADPVQIEQVVINLCVNARDAMPGGGELVISTRSLLLAPHGDMSGGPFIELAVRDSGDGIEDRYLDRVFEPFFSTKQPGEGTGLGLSTVYGIARQCGGDVRVRSVVGEGTVFEVLLPRTEATVTQVPEEVLPAASTVEADGTILVVEDETALRRLLTKALTTSGYEVLSGADGLEALELARAYPGRIDLVITDVVMPRMAGPEFVRELRRMRPEVKVIFTSGYPEGFHTRLEAGTYFLAKPFGMAGLHTEIREALA